MLPVATPVDVTARGQRFVNCLGLLFNSSNSDILRQEAGGRAFEQGVSPIGSLVFLRRDNSVDASLDAGASERMAVKFARGRDGCHLSVGCSVPDTLGSSNVGKSWGGLFTSKYGALNPKGRSTASRLCH